MRFGAAEMYLAWFAASLFYYYQYILRVAPNVLGHDMRIEFGITADQFASLGSLYLLAYSLMQIPLGILTDKIGVRRMVIISIIGCILGGLLFARTEIFAITQFSRILIGASSAAALMCALKLIADEFPLGKRGILMGITLTMGTAGAMSSKKFVEGLGQEWGWRDASLFSVVLGVIMLILSIALIPRTKTKLQDVHKQHEGSMYETLMSIMKHRYIMTYAVIAIGLYSPLAVFGDLWGGSFLSRKFSLAESEATSASLLLYFGLGIGSIVIPWYGEKFKIINEIIIVCSVGILGTLSLLVYGPAFDLQTLKMIMIAIGVFGGAEMLCFTAALQYSKVTNSGEIIGVVNTLNMLGAAALAQVVGALLDYKWAGKFVDHTNYYSASDYVDSMLPITVTIGICVAVSLTLLYKGKEVKS